MLKLVYIIQLVSGFCTRLCNEVEKVKVRFQFKRQSSKINTAEIRCGILV